MKKFILNITHELKPTVIEENEQEPTVIEEKLVTTPDLEYQLFLG